MDARRPSRVLDLRRWRDQQRLGGRGGRQDLIEFMVYPGEFHYFDRSFVVRDAWTRVDNFFRKHLKPELATGRK
jgi:hypothetical protein